MSDTGHADEAWRMFLEELQALHGREGVDAAGLAVATRIAKAAFYAGFFACAHVAKDAMETFANECEAESQAAVREQ